MTDEPTLKENQAVILERLIEVRCDIADIKSQFRGLNGSVKETMIKLAVTDTLAKNNQKKVEEALLAAVENPKENRRYIDRLFITALGSLMTALAAIIVVIIEIVIKT